jgi:hypothetical protein
LKEIAPSTELRKWFGHDPDKWKSFRGRYETEIRHKDYLVEVLKQKAKKGMITLLYGARDEKHNEALVLKQFLERISRLATNHPELRPLHSSHFRHSNSAPMRSHRPSGVATHGREVNGGS